MPPRGDSPTRAPWTRKKRPRKWSPYLYKLNKPGEIPQPKIAEAPALPPIHVVWGQYLSDYANTNVNG